MESAYTHLQHVPEEDTETARSTDNGDGAHGHGPAPQPSQETLQEQLTRIKNSVGQRMDYREE